MSTTIKLLSLTATLAIASGSALADMTICKNGNITRRVEVSHQDNDSSKPCEVRYYKDTEKPGEAAQVLWSFQSHVDQCAAKAQDFIQNKLTAMGYSCSAEGGQ